MPGFHAGNACRQREESYLNGWIPKVWLWKNPFDNCSSADRIVVPTMSHVQSDAFWKLVVEEIIRTTDNLILEGRHRQNVKTYLATMLDARMESIFVTRDYQSGDIEAIPELFARAQRKWDMDRVALALIVIYHGIWRKGEAGHSLTTDEIDLALYIDKTAIDMAQRQTAAGSVFAIMKELVFLASLPLRSR
jgi:hypothetical protein